MRLSVKQLSRAAMVGALYAAICFFLKPLSYGAIQLRISEVLCVLPVFMPEAICGLLIGCLIANLIGGASIAIIDMVFGSLTTLLAAFSTHIIYKKTKSFIISLLPPVLLNAFIVGSYIPFIYSDTGTPATLPLVIFSIFTVGIGQGIVVYLFGLPLGKALAKTKLFTC